MKGLVRELEGGKRLVACVIDGHREDGTLGRGVIFMSVKATQVLEGHTAYIHDSPLGQGLSISMYGGKIAGDTFKTVNEAAMAGSKRVQGGMKNGIFDRAVEDGKAMLKKALKFGEVKPLDPKEAAFKIDRTKPGNYELATGFVKVKWKSEATQAVCTNCGHGFSGEGLQHAGPHAAELGHEVVYGKAK